jgi:hypothetical protein
MDQLEKSQVPDSDLMHAEPIGAYTKQELLTSSH